MQLRLTPITRSASFSALVLAVAMAGFFVAALTGPASFFAVMVKLTLCGVICRRGKK